MEDYCIYGFLLCLFTREDKRKLENRFISQIIRYVHSYSNLHYTIPTHLNCEKLLFIKSKMKKLPKDVQTLFSATTRIHSYKRAVEELVYNALDANSTSIALRVNIDDHTIQAIDNGNGIGMHDMKLVGQKHMTSKTVDITTLKSTSNNYGYRGQSLASIIEVSEKVTITSRVNDETMVKTFCRGKEKDVLATLMRPSKGTTAEIKGFLYNHNIQRKNIDQLHELQEIMQFLEQLSLVHNNVSISLRDDSINEIIFQVHKSRDIYQTLHSLFSIKRENCMELNVEKKTYKVTAYIGKTINTDKENHWIYLNGRHLKNSHLQKAFDEEMVKVLALKRTGNKNPKQKQPYDDNCLFKKKIPFYFIFVTCPYSDYDLNYSETMTNVEFKKWENVTTLLQKLAKFYVGDVKIKNDKRNALGELNDKPEGDEVKKIVEKFLGNQSKKLGVSQMQNGIKGRTMKRNKAKKNNISLSKIIIKNNDVNNSKELDKMECIDFNNKVTKDNKTAGNKTNTFNEVSKTVKEKRYKTKVNKGDTISKKKVKMVPVKVIDIDNIQFKNKCKFAAARANKLLRKKIGIQKSNFKNTLKYSTIRTNIQTISVTQQTEEVIASNIAVCKEPVIHNRVTKTVVKKDCKSTYDLLQTILNSQNESNARIVDKCGNLWNEDQDIRDEDRLTFQSHHYNVENRYEVAQNNTNRRNRFITTKSRDDFTFEHVFRRPKQKQRCRPYSKWHGKRSVFNFEQESSYTIEFTDTHKQDYFNINQNVAEESVKGNNILKTIMSQIVESNNFRLTNTSTMQTVLGHSNSFNENYYKNNHETYTVDIHDSEDESYNDIEEYRRKLHIEEPIKPMCVEFISNTQSSNKNDVDSLQLEPLNICETLLNNNEDESFENGFQNHCVEVDVHNVESRVDVPETTNLRNVTTSNPVQAPSIEDLIETSHHFQLNKTLINELERHETNFTHNSDPGHKNISNCKDINSIETLYRSGGQCRLDKRTGMTVVGRKSMSPYFNLRERPGFMPKGLSPILENCNTKNACDNNLESEYFNDSMYNQFEKEVETNAEVFEANIRHVNDWATSDIERVNTRLKKDNASLVFDGSCLKDAKVLGQVDCKLIAAILRERDTAAAHVVLVDQHAAHERVRVERLIDEYLKDDQWESVPVDEIKINLKRDDIAVLLNYKDKFAQLGLRAEPRVEPRTESRTKLRTCNTIAVSAVPRALLGKNPRPAEVVIEAVKSLIQEEIQTLKSQKGSLNLYPKSIMDLVCSEACRYAIKFGASISHRSCVRLLSQLRSRRAPFQCAHGRPALAALAAVPAPPPAYRINLDNVKMFLKNCPK